MSSKESLIIEKTYKKFSPFNKTGIKQVLWKWQVTKDFWFLYTTSLQIDKNIVDNVVIVFHLGRIQIFRRMFYTIDIYILNTFQHILIYHYEM